MTPPAWQFDMQLTRANLIALAGLSVLACLAMGASLAGESRTWFTNTPPIDRTKIEAATEKIDPNTASVASLRRLPGIGVVRAENIVIYRLKHKEEHFNSPADLNKIHGIGPGTVNKIWPYLVFPKTPAQK